MNAYCDTPDNSIVKTKQVVFNKGVTTPIVKLVNKENEKEIRDLFKKTLVARNKGKEAQEIIESTVIEADKDLETVSAEAIIKLIIGEVTKDIRERFTKVKEARKRADHSVEAGREYTEAYVQFTHQAERYTLMLQCIQDIITGHTKRIIEDKHKYKGENCQISDRKATRRIKPGDTEQSQCCS